MAVVAKQSRLNVVQIGERALTSRRSRKPRHPFNLKSKPYEITPFCVAPVLPGETMQNLLLQSRVVTDPIQNALIGWHKEYHYFYVKHRALSAWDTTGLLQTMMLTPGTDVSSLKASANNIPYYTFKGGMEFVEEAVTAIVLNYFRDEGETVAPAGEYYPYAQLDHESWLQSLKLESGGADDEELPGVDGIEETDIHPAFTAEYAQWELMRDAGFTDATYEDYLRSYGVSIPKAEDKGLTPDEMHRPELIFSKRVWSYPSNTVNPSDGIPASAVSWSIAERGDKKRFFKEPGFIVGLTVAKPKLYFGSQKGAAVGLLNSAYRWLPAVLNSYPYSSIAEELDSATDGILQGGAEDYWMDVRDLFLHGDQFVNHAMSAAANHGIAVPTAALVYKYPTDAMIESLFKTAGSEYVREDGVTMFNILGRQVEGTP